jgi:hypothetical protein
MVHIGDAHTLSREGTAKISFANGDSKVGGLRTGG